LVVSFSFAFPRKFHVPQPLVVGTRSRGNGAAPNNLRLPNYNSYAMMQ